MSKVVNRSCWVLLCLIFLSPIQAVVAADEDIVFVRKDCSGTGSNQTCFTTLSALQSWLWSIRQPSASSPVSVNIGPGDFTGSIVCPSGSGFVSFIGSGPENTKLINSSDTVHAENCTNLNFQDLSLKATSTYTIRWIGGGSSRWINVDVFGPWNTWLDYAIECGGTKPVHYWFNSRLQSPANAVANYKTGCGESWFYASEITYLVSGNVNNSVFQLEGDADVRLFGSVVRAIVPDGSDPGGGRNAFVSGARLIDSSNFHMHGGIISLNVSPLTGNVGLSALENYGTGIIHTPDTAFALKPAGTGAVYRTYSGNGPVHSPFTWPPGTNPPPLASDSASSDGADIFVETDCDMNGDCDTAPAATQKPHMMIYTSKCSVNGPWFDVVRGKCRGAP